MAEEKNNLEYQNEAYHEVKKSRFQAFKDFFKGQKALPESTESRHKTTNVDMRTSMSLASLRASIVERVGNFFEAISKIGSPRKEENLNQFAKEVVGAPNKDNTIEKTRTDDENVVSQQPRYFPGNVAVKTSHEPLNHGTIIIAETSIEDKIQEDSSKEHDSSVDTGVIDVDKDFKEDKTAVATIESSGISAGTINVTPQNEITQNPEAKQKNVIIPGTIGKTPRANDEKDGPDL